LNPDVTHSRPLLLGHRGARRYAAENTFAAFDLALEHGCDGFEFDVRRTADGRCVICHDPELLGLPLATASYDELVSSYSKSLPRMLQIGHGALPPEGLSVPCLEDVLARYAARAFLYVELKVTGVEDAVLAALHANPPQRGYVVASFLPDVLQAVHARSGRVPLGLICNDRRALDRWRNLPVQYVMPQHRLVSRALVEELHSAGKKVFVWTVNQGKEMLTSAQAGVNAILSDDTKLLCRTLRTSE